MVSITKFLSKRRLIGLALGQFVSLLVTATGFASSELSRRGINAPTSQSFFNYVLLAVAYGGWMIYRKKPLQMKWYFYLLLGFIDVEANYLAGSSPMKGDLLVIIGSMLYAVSNVSEEFLVKNGDRTELMAMLGVFGAIISACQISILERSELKSIHWTTSTVSSFIGFFSAMFLFYSTVPIVLKISGSAMLNLSLLTSDMWTVLIRIFAYHEKVDWMYFLAFVAFTIGLISYSWGSDEDEKRSRAADTNHEQAKAMDEEARSGDSHAGPSSSIGQGFGDGKDPYYFVIRNEE